MSAGAQPSSAPLFSIVILARDEAGSLPRLLLDLAPFRDRGGEVLVLDSGSTDYTVPVAREHGCRVEMVEDRFDSTLTRAQAAEIEKRFSKAPNESPLVAQGQRLFNFGDARQYAGELASRHFVLQLDSCDTVSALDIDTLNGWIASGRPGSFEYDQLYDNLSLRIARFYDRGRFHWEGRVHEVMLPNSGVDVSLSPRMRCDRKQLVVCHKQGEKERNYMAGLALQVIEHPEKPRWWHFLARELYYFRCYNSAIAAFEVHLEMKDAWQTERAQSVSFIAECLEGLKRPDEAKAMYLRAYEMDKTRREPLIHLAMLCSSRREFAEAVRWTREAMTIPRTNAYPEFDANYTWVPHSLLYWALFWLKQKDEARIHWEAYRSLVPEEKFHAEHARMFPPVGQ
jgi:glycosyltransferase involved in cell wall biosynthesis